MLFSELDLLQGSLLPVIGVGNSIFEMSAQHALHLTRCPASKTGFSSLVETQGS